MSKITCGITCLSFGLVATLFTILTSSIFFIFPAIARFVKDIFYISLIPLILSCIGILFYYLQWRRFTLRWINIGLAINILNLVIGIYITYQMALSL
jgi:hypothetical protein